MRVMTMMMDDNDNELRITMTAIDMKTIRLTILMTILTVRMVAVMQKNGKNKKQICFNGIHDEQEQHN